ncbi:hypothetical protein ACQKDS_00595 [Serratia sp. NPDC078593]
MGVIAIARQIKNIYPESLALSPDGQSESLRALTQVSNHAIRPSANVT